MTKKKIQASEVEVGNRNLEAVLLDLAERSVRAEERSARAEERSARAEERSARAEERCAIALETLASLTRDHMGLAKRTERVEGRVDALEKAS